MQFKHMLVALAPGQSPYDGFDQALRFSEIQHGHVTLICVLDDLPDTRMTRPNTFFKALELRNEAIKQQTSHLEQLQFSLARSYPATRFDFEIRIGIPFIEIVTACERRGCDLIVIDANRGGKRNATQYGSTTRHLMRKSPAPVWTISMGRMGNANRVAAAIDINAPTAQGLQLNRKILRYAHSVAAMQQAELHLFHAWRLEGEGYMRNWGRLTPLELEKAIREELKQRRESLNTLMHDCELAFNDEHLHLYEGQAQETLPVFVQDVAIDMLVMGTVCRTGIQGFVMGNTAESMLDAVDCSVLTLKPDTFVSPIASSLASAGNPDKLDHLTGT